MADAPPDADMGGYTPVTRWELLSRSGAITTLPMEGKSEAQLVAVGGSVAILWYEWVNHVINFHVDVWDGTTFVPLWHTQPADPNHWGTVTLVGASDTPVAETLTEFATVP
jgi:hypothetical protein